VKVESHDEASEDVQNREPKCNFQKRWQTRRNRFSAADVVSDEVRVLKWRKPLLY